MENKDAIKLVKFKDLNLEDPFFDSLRDDYEGLDEAFAIQISKVTPYKKQLDLSELEDGNLKAPQSFIYLNG